MIWLNFMGKGCPEPFHYTWTPWTRKWKSCTTFKNNKLIPVLSFCLNWNGLKDWEMWHTIERCNIPFILLKVYRRIFGSNSLNLNPKECRKFKRPTTLPSVASRNLVTQPFLLVAKRSKFVKFYWCKEMTEYVCFILLHKLKLMQFRLKLYIKVDILMVQIWIPRLWLTKL